MCLRNLPLIVQVFIINMDLYKEVVSQPVNLNDTNMKSLSIIQYTGLPVFIQNFTKYNTDFSRD
jgi:hypothetical protein